MTLWPPIAAALAVALLLVQTPTQAEVVFPTGSRIGIEPPAGMTASEAFPGYEDPEKNIAILLVELPGPAYAEAEKAMTLGALTRQGFVGEKREAFPIQNGKAVLFIGHQDVGGVRLRKWILTASVGDLTALVTVQMRETASKEFPEAAIRKALATLQVRANPLEEQLGRVPFKLTELAGFRIVKVVGTTTVLLTLGPKDDVEAVDQPHMLVNILPGSPPLPERTEFARQAMGAITGFKTMRLTSNEPMRVLGLPGIEVRADAVNARSETEVSLIQWLRFGTNSVLRIVGVTPKESWDENYPKFRAIRDGLEPR